MALCVALAACGGRDDDGAARPLLEGHNVLIINIDALRADHLGIYGYERNTSPFIDRLASEGIVFERARANSSFTRESVAALFSGRLPTCGDAIGWAAAPSPLQPSLGERFREAGYRTGFFSNTIMLRNTNFTRGFEEIQHLPRDWSTSGMGPALSGRVSEFIARHVDEPFLLYLHYLDPHGPYQPPDENLRRFAASPIPDPLEVYRGLRGRLPSMLENGFGAEDARFQDLVARYDAEVSHTDEAVGQLLATLERHDLMDRTLVAVTADHGEEFLEHAFVEHGWTLYEESIRIPLVFWAPGALEPARVDIPASSVDLLPTLIELLGLPGRDAVLDGRPLLVDGRPDSASRNEPIVAELMVRERNLLRSVVQGDWKYIAAYRWLDPAERRRAIAEEDALRERGYPEPLDPWGSVVREELYRLPDDPDEQRDLSEEEPEKLLEMRETLAAYRAHCEASGGQLREPDPAAPAPSAEERERLRALGYLGE